MNITVNRLFSDNMVLQRNKRVPIWGTASNDCEIIVEIENEFSISTTSVKGKWKIELPEMEANSRLTMIVRCGEERIEIHNVSFGEVWVAGGQSNMEFYLRYDKEYLNGVKEENPDIYFFDYPEVSYVGQINEKDYSNFGFWRTCTIDNLDYYSAVAYYFAQKIQNELGVPIGIIGCNVGGTNASCWMGEEYLKGTSGEIWLDEYNEAINSLDIEEYISNYYNTPFSYTGNPFADSSNEALLLGMTKEEMIGVIEQIRAMNPSDYMPPMGPRSLWRPCGVYETMLKHVAPYSISGVIWYQGCSDDVHADVYDVVLANMIRCWRNLWKEKIPFLITQIAPLGMWFSGEVKNYPLIREQQEKVASTLSNVWLITTGDVGCEWDVHPKEKRPVGNRLALLALGHVYNQDILCDPPKVVGMLVEDKRIVLSFVNTGERLIVKGESINVRSCRCDGIEIRDCDISASGSNIIIKNEIISPESKVEVRFAMTPYYEINIFNSSDIPARPFYINNFSIID